MKFDFFALEIIFGSYFMLRPERISGNFLQTSITAVPTCCEPPYTISPAVITSLPDFTRRPEIPNTSIMFFGFFLAKTKFV